VAVPVHLDLRLGRLGRAARGVTQGAPLRAAIAGECPRCVARTLFAGWLRFADKCRACGLDFSRFNVGDGPAAFLIFIVGTITVVGALLVDGAFSPPWWVHLVWIPVATALTVGGLRVSKAWLLAQEYRHRAREGRVAE
jgi:uncharacterized protein (DUF983 family)